MLWCARPCVVCVASASLFGCCWFAHVLGMRVEQDGGDADGKTAWNNIGVCVVVFVHHIPNNTIFACMLYGGCC